MSERAKWVARLAQATQDLEELEHQLAEEEIPPSEGQKLREIYLQEMEEARLWLTEEASARTDNEAPPGPRRESTRFWNPGRVTVAVILGAAAIVLVISVGWFTQPEEDQSAAGGEAFDPSRYSNETMEAVITANDQHPQINGMRMALAERYFQAGDFSGAFPHYRGVLEHNPTSDEEADALSRLGWMAWVGSEEVALAIETLDRALETVPGHPQALYFKAIVLWCGSGQPTEAVPLLERVIETFPSETGVASELAAARAGEGCS